MKLPLRVHYDYFGWVQVIDADKVVIAALREERHNRKVAQALVRRMNWDWRWRLFGFQPFEYTRDNWLYDKHKGV